MYFCTANYREKSKHPKYDNVNSRSPPALSENQARLLPYKICGKTAVPATRIMRSTAALHDYNIIYIYALRTAAAAAETKIKVNCLFSPSDVFLAISGRQTNLHHAQKETTIKRSYIYTGSVHIHIYI